MADETAMEVDREAAKKNDKMFTLKKWNLVAMWSWDVECDTCAICRVQVMGKYPIYYNYLVDRSMSLIETVLDEYQLSPYFTYFLVIFFLLC